MMDLVNKFYVDENSGEIFEVVDKVNETTVMVKEYDTKDAGQLMMPIEELVAPNFRFFDGALEAQKYVSDTFEENAE